MYLFLFSLHMKSDIYSYTNTNFTESTSSIFVPIEPNEKAIDKDDCIVRNFVLLLFNDNIHPGSITLQ